VKPKGDLNEFVTQNFKNLAGKMYRPSDWEDKILLAFEKSNDSQIQTIEESYIVKYTII
jgi:hypothetical protein